MRSINSGDDETNRTAIEYVINPDGTQGFNWPIVTGCLHPCRDVYCYNTMKKTSPLNRFFKDNRKKEAGELHLAKPEEGMYPYGFDPTVYLHRLEEPKHRKKSSTIFVANGGDILGQWIYDEIVDSILDIIRQCPQHTFIILTKNWGRLFNFEFPDNAWVGVSRENGDRPFHNMVGIKAKTRFISFEPLHSGFGYDLSAPRYLPGHSYNKSKRDENDGYRRIEMNGVNWIVAGRETGPREEQFIPERDWIITLVRSAQEQQIPIWMKNNLAPVPFNKTELIQELPKRGIARS